MTPHLGEVVLVKGYEGSPYPYVVAIVTGAIGCNVAVTLFPRSELPQCVSVPLFPSELAADEWLRGRSGLAYSMAAFPRPTAGAPAPES